MEHPFIDHYAGLDSLVHRLDPRVKVVTALVAVAAIVSLRSVPGLLGALALLALLARIAGLPLHYLLARMAWVLPFSGTLLLVMPFLHTGNPLFRLEVGPFAVTAGLEGLARAVVYSLRLAGSLLAAVLLTSTTRFSRLLRAMEELGLPGVFTRVVDFGVRYSFLLVDELQRMQRARYSRGFVPRSILQRLTAGSLGETAGALFLRSLERADRVHRAMLSRNYAGDFRGRTMGPVKMAEVGQGLLVAGLALLLVILERGWR